MRQDYLKNTKIASLTRDLLFKSKRRKGFLFDGGFEERNLINHSEDCG